MNPCTTVQDEQHKWLVVACLLVVALAAALRLTIVDRQGLWADEAFSLAMATGHSLEHPPSQAKPELGDYIEAPRPLPALEYRRYLEHQNPPVGPAGVIRAVRLSDTSPPLYYLVLWAWTRVAGTSDAALRLFSVLWAMACFPFIWWLAKEIGSKSAILPALVLFSVSPLSIYYSTEGRMYSMLCFLALSTAWLTLRLNERGPRPITLVLWILVGTAGMLTHYFYLFVLLACWAWLLIYPGKLSRILLLAGSSGIAVLIAPWYLQIPESLSLWRVTQGWLYYPSVPNRSIAALTLPWTFVSPSSNWWNSDSRLDYLAAVVFILLAILAAGRLGLRLFSERRQLIWLWLVVACLGPLIFDGLMGTFTTAVPRYAIAGMPAGVLLAGLALSQLNRALRAVFMILILVAWLPSTWTVLTNSVRGWEPFRQVASVLDDQVGESDVVIVHSIPSGVLAVARYLQRPINVFSWVSQLKQRRVPEDIQKLAEKYNRIVLVKIHTVEEPVPEETWLRTHSDLRQELSSADVLFFVSQKEL